MAGLILKLRAHEQVLVNGVVLQNGERNARLIIRTPNARVLRLRDAIPADEAEGPVGRLCYLAQLAVASDSGEGALILELASRIEDLRRSLGDLAEAAHLDAALDHLRERNVYGALRALRRLLPLEAQLHAAGTPQPRSPSEN